MSLMIGGTPKFTPWKPRMMQASATKTSTLAVNSKATMKEMYYECFPCVGKFKDFEYHIDIDGKARQIVQALGKIDLSL